MNKDTTKPTVDPKKVYAAVSSSPDPHEYDDETGSLEGISALSHPKIFVDKISNDVKLKRETVLSSDRLDGKGPDKRFTDKPRIAWLGERMKSSTRLPPRRL